MKIKHFDCDCFSREHIIRASLYKEENYADLNLEFNLFFNDNRACDYSKNFLYKFYKKFLWRIKHAILILFVGELSISDSWSPARTFDEKNTIENTFGYKNALELAEFIKGSAEEIKKFYNGN